MLTWFSVIWSLFQFLVSILVLVIFGFKKHIESIMLCYTLAYMRDFASQGLWSFPDDIFNFFVGEPVENNWGKTGGVWFSLIWSQFQFLVTIDYFLGKKHIDSMLYASTQPEGELLSSRYGRWTTQHIHVRSDNECWIIPYPPRCTKVSWV